MISPRTGLYRHFKGNVYRVLDVAIDAANSAGPDDGIVFYLSLKDGKKYARTCKEFLQYVRVFEEAVPRHETIEAPDEYDLDDRRVHERFAYIGQAMVVLVGVGLRGDEEEV